MKASDLFVKALEKEGVEYIFGLPGEENLDLVESISQSKQIKFIVNRHEQAAGFMAATYGRLTGKAGVCLSTLGPGATNLVTAAAYAQLGAMPMMMITGQKPIKTSKQGQFQIINVVDMMRPLTKYTRQIVNANNIPSRIREAFRLAQEERPGAVHLELPEDIADENTDTHLFEPSAVNRPVADSNIIREAARMIEAARHPMMLIGAGANRQDTSPALQSFVETFGIPFMDTQMGQGVVSGDNLLYLGNAALSENDYLHCAIGRSDLIINVGHDVVEKPPFIMEHGGRKVIHINFSTASVDPVYFPQLEVIGDIAYTIEHLKHEITKQPTWDFSYFLKVKQELDKHLLEGTEDLRFPIIPQRLVHDVRQAMPKGGIVALDNGMFKIWFARNYRVYYSNSLLLDNALASMGAGLPSAMAAKLVYPGKKVLAVCGDGGFLMNSQELETAKRLNIDLVVMIVRDDGYGMIKWKQHAMGFRDFGLNFQNPDFVKYAESYGLNGRRVERTEDLAPVLKECLEAPGIHIVDVPVDYSENHRVFNQELREKTCLV